MTTQTSTQNLELLLDDPIAIFDFATGLVYGNKPSEEELKIINRVRESIINEKNSEFQYCRLAEYLGVLRMRAKGREDVLSQIEVIKRKINPKKIRQLKYEKDN